MLKGQYRGLSVTGGLVPCWWPWGRGVTAEPSCVQDIAVLRAELTCILLCSAGSGPQRHAPCNQLSPHPTATHQGCCFPLQVQWKACPTQPRPHSLRQLPPPTHPASPIPPSQLTTLPLMLLLQRRPLVSRSQSSSPTTSSSPTASRASSATPGVTAGPTQIDRWSRPHQMMFSSTLCSPSPPCTSCSHPAPCIRMGPRWQTLVWCPGART